MMIRFCNTLLFWQAKETQGKLFPQVFPLKARMGGTGKTYLPTATGKKLCASVSPPNAPSSSSFSWPSCVLLSPGNDSLMLKKQCCQVGDWHLNGDWLQTSFYFSVSKLEWNQPVLNFWCLIRLKTGITALRHPCCSASALSAEREKSKRLLCPEASNCRNWKFIERLWECFCLFPKYILSTNGTARAEVMDWDVFFPADSS